MNTGYGDPSASTPLSTGQTSAWFEMEKSCKRFKGKYYKTVSQIMESFPMEDFREKKKVLKTTTKTQITRKDTVNPCFKAQGVGLNALTTTSSPSFLISSSLQLQSCTLRTAFTSTKCLQIETKKNKLKKTRHWHWPLCHFYSKNQSHINSKANKILHG